MRDFKMTLFKVSNRSFSLQLKVYILIFEITKILKTPNLRKIPSISRSYNHLTIFLVLEQSPFMPLTNFCFVKRLLEP